MEQELESQEHEGKIEFADFLTSMAKRNVDVD